MTTHPEGRKRPNQGRDLIVFSIRINPMGKLMVSKRLWAYLSSIRNGTFSTMRLVRCDWILLILAAVLIVFGVVTWITFPIIYKKEVDSNLQFTQHEDKTLSTAAWQWSHPPMNNIMSFYFFNVTNPDEIIYDGAKPAVVELGPWTVQEKEQKKYMQWSEDGQQVFYENYKTYYERSDLCDGCSLNDLVTIPNPTGLGAAADMWDPQYNVSDSGRVIISWGLLLLGEHPFVTQSVGDILFNGYNDALLTAAHSELLHMIEVLYFGGRNIIPIPIPDMPRMGFFQGYNNTQDEYYWVRTGKSDVDRLGEVVTWANQTSLPWWGDDYANSIRGSDSGSFSKTHLQKTDVVPMFQSFFCRSFDAVYLNETTVHSIPAYTFSVDYDQWDTTADKNSGFRYRNVEEMNYFPDWPSCPDRNQSDCENPKAVDCSLQANLCNNCCNGSYVGGTYLIPPGLYPLVCYPGRLEPSPFSVMYSPPHFVYSPEQVANSIYGLSPNIEQHRPLMYTHEPYSGTVVEAVVQLMVNMPTMPNKVVFQCMQMPTSIIPLFWQSARAYLYDDTYHLIWIGFVFVPRIVDVIKYCAIGLGLFIVAIVAFRVFRRK